MVRLYGRGMYICGGTLAQEHLTPFRCEFANRPPLVDLLTYIPQ